MAAGKRPDFNLCVKPKKGTSYTQIGVAWEDDQGRGFNIKLNPCVVLSHSDSVRINLFPVDDNNQRGGRRRQYKADSEADYDNGPPPMTDDDVPF